ncbi:MAG: dihydrofolate reductase [Pyrinomonadaceae bacterium]|nr:dihydrofolate reductase [Blastocatellia bacterium]MDQ3219519.1 dihydrofolate reductase [Acidobacteriota bacterium]MDQ3490905.1 dihydrofolate reductase [Acidobacteriota bacterium]
MIVGIVAVAKNHAIGKDGKLPWHYSSDLKFFKQTTTGHAVVMGFNTWRSIGKPLPNRLNIVLSRSAQLEDDSNLLFLSSKEQVLKLSGYLKCDLFIIGGAKTYVEFADVIDKWIVTEVPLTIDDADVFMPGDFLAGFELSESNELKGGPVVKTFQR